MNGVRFLGLKLKGWTLYTGSQLTNLIVLYSPRGKVLIVSSPKSFSHFTNGSPTSSKILSLPIRHIKKNAVCSHSSKILKPLFSEA